MRQGAVCFQSKRFNMSEYRYAANLNNLEKARVALHRCYSAVWAMLLHP